MKHPIYRVISIKKVAAYTLKLTFDDQTVQTIHFRPVLKGPLYGELNDEHLFDQVVIDPEAHTLVWPNGADFDPTTLHDWPKYETHMKELAKRWQRTTVVSASE